MSDPNEDTPADRIIRRNQRILACALQETGIYERNDSNQFPSPFGGTLAYWQEVRDDIELVINSRTWEGSLNFSIRLKWIAAHAGWLFENDSDAVEAVV